MVSHLTFSLDLTEITARTWSRKVPRQICSTKGIPPCRIFYGLSWSRGKKNKTPRKGYWRSACQQRKQQSLFPNDDHGGWTKRKVLESFFQLNQSGGWGGRGSWVGWWRRRKMLGVFHLEVIFHFLPSTRIIEDMTHPFNCPYKECYSQMSRPLIVSRPFSSQVWPNLSNDSKFIHLI